MNKNVIALAVAAAMAAPLAAQAEVKISGQMQAEIVNWGGDGATGLTMNDAQEGGSPDSGNFGALNFSASEDLGNGMKALAKIGMKINAPSGTSNGDRDAYVGVSGGFGTVLMGTMSTPYKMATVKWDPFLATSGQARGNTGASILHNGYASNVVAYANKFGMAKVVAAIALDESKVAPSTDYNNEHTLSVSLNMPVGPVELAVGYHDVGTAGSDGTSTKIGVKYAAGAIGVSAVIENVGAGSQKNWTGGVMANDGETYTLLSGTYTMGANTFALNYGMNAQDYVGGSMDNTNMTVGVVHSFSKKVSAHAAYTSVDLDGTEVNGIAGGLRVKF